MTLPKLVSAAPPLDHNRQSYRRRRQLKTLHGSLRARLSAKKDVRLPKFIYCGSCYEADTVWPETGISRCGLPLTEQFSDVVEAVV